MSILTDTQKFVDAYIEAALWSSTNDNDEPLDTQGYDMAPEAIERMTADCQAFLDKHRELISDYEQAGHDFWLTRNRHGTGFWDGGWPEPTATVLTEASHLVGTCDLSVGDDGLVYVY